MGYHKREIPKGELGEFSKITEEYTELLDANEQSNPILELVELADLVGAIEAYTRKQYNIALEDIFKMTLATESAFKDGSRK